MNLQTRVVGDVYVLTPHHDLLGGKETDELLAAADEIVAKGPPRIIVDLGEIKLVMSRGISALVKIHTSCVTRGGWMRLARINRRIHDVLQITRLIMVFETYDTIEEAIVGKVAHEEPSARGKQKKPARRAAKAGSNAAVVSRDSDTGKAGHRG